MLPLPPPWQTRASRRCVSTPFAPAPLPSRAKASRGDLWRFNTIRMSSTSHAKVRRRCIHVTFRRRSHVLYLPRMRKRTEDDSVLRFSAVRSSSTSLACKSEPEVDLWRFETICMSSTSLACKNEPELGFSCVSTPFACPPPPSHAKASWRFIHVAFRLHSHVLHLPRMQKRAGGGLMAFLHHLCLPRVQDRAGGGFMTFRHCPRLLHLPRVQVRTGGGLLSTVWTSPTSLAYRCELEVTPFGHLPLPRVQG